MKHRLEIACAAADGGIAAGATHSLGLTRKPTTVQPTAQSLPISVLDLVPTRAGEPSGRAIARSVELARHAEQLGYKCYWVAEHHAIQGMACSATPMLIGHIAAATKTIRVGSGGVTLPNHAPLVVAEQFGTLNRHLINNEELEPTLSSEVTVGAALIFMPACSKIPFLRFGTRAGIAMTLLNAKRR